MDETQQALIKRPTDKLKAILADAGVQEQFKNALQVLGVQPEWMDCAAGSGVDRGLDCDDRGKGVA